MTGGRLFGKGIRVHHHEQVAVLDGLPVPEAMTFLDPGYGVGAVVNQSLRL
jgi:hypothetical protein